jgi:serine/threonine-protein kinase PknK
MADWHKDGTGEPQAPALPPRYAAVARLGKGGGGEVWAVRDLVDGRTYALKSLSDNATEREVLALVREASALSGLEGLGVPRVLRFGRLPGDGRPYMLRELVEGRSLAERLDGDIDADGALLAVVRAADQLTRLHRASLLHGDVKPANVIVGDDGSATLVDLGLAAPWRERGQSPVGLSPGYAAPELFMGEALTVRAEVYALGATLRDVVETLRPSLSPARERALDEVVARATSEEPSERFPSADELASALRHAGGLVIASGIGMADAAWPIVGIDATVARLLTTVAGLPPGAAIEIQGRPGAGRTAILRRLAWSLGVEGRAVAWIEAGGENVPRAVAAELSGCQSVSGVVSGVVVLIDDAEMLAAAELGPLLELRKAGAKFILTSSVGFAERAFGGVEAFSLPPLDRQVASSLVRRAIPSLNDAVIAHVVARAEGRPGKLRSIVRRLDGMAVVSPADVDRLAAGGSPAAGVGEASDPAEAAAQLLDQGRLTEAALQVAKLDALKTPTAGILRARLLLGQGNAEGALRALDEVQAAGRIATLYRARAVVRRGNYQEAAALSDEALSPAARQASPARPSSDPLDADLLTCRGVAESYLGDHVRAFATLSRSVDIARRSGDRRVEGLALASLALGLQRSDRLGEAKRAYEEALEAAEDAGDAGGVATVRLNLATIASSGQGEIAEALSHLEAAVDMGSRAGRASTVQQALLNLANLDLYLGRLARAAASIEQLASQREELPAGSAAQLMGLEAELSARSGDVGRASSLYERCAAAYEALSRNVDAAEARIEAVLVATRSGDAEPTQLAATLERATVCLGNTPAHRAALCLARGAVAALARDEARARQAFGEALSAAREAGQKEWIWRTLDSRSRLEVECGRPLAARRDAEEALAVLEDIAARLPRDLREVYWNDPRRRGIRTAVAGDSRHLLGGEARGDSAHSLSGIGGGNGNKSAGGTSTRFLEEDRLARLLEINRELATVHDVGLVLERVIAHAAALLQAERGYVLLTTDEGGLTVHTSRERTTDETHRQFSKSIAERAIASGEPVVTMSARDDARMTGFESVHHLNLQSVACVPIRSPRGGFIGALYLETRSRPGALFERELRTIRAFADQAAIAIENAHLLEENARRAEALARTNTELEAAKARLRELLDQKRAQLEVTRKDLKDTRAVLRSHFGYGGLFGTSTGMRKVYALIDRVKDTDIPVLITGESGTGKEMVARAIHEAGPRAKRPFTGVNCGAIPENLLESELFGHVRGAFTGAERDRRGLFRETEGGTILLDEIGEMPLKMQAGLLRVLQERVVRPVGGTREEPIDVRVIAATNRDLLAMVGDGTFREDLYYRLRVVEVGVPPLRDRPDDIPVLIDHFLQIFAARYRREKGSVSRDALRALMGYSWQGNVRQLQNVLLNAWVLGERSELEAADFDLPQTSRPAPLAGRPSASAPASSRDLRGRPTAGSSPGHPDAAGPASSSGSGSSPASIADHRAAEREKILDALRISNWNRVKAAQILDMPRRTFYRRLKDYGIQ